LPYNYSHKPKTMATETKKIEQSNTYNVIDSMGRIKKIYIISSNMETLEQLYLRNPKAKFKLAKGRNRIFCHFWKTRDKNKFCVSCVVGNRVKLDRDTLVFEVTE